MSAHADDLRYFYGEDIGDTIEFTLPDGVSNPLRDEALEPGRYVLRILDFNGGDIWVRQGANGDVIAAASPPSTRFRSHTDVPSLNLPVATFMVRAGGTGPNPKGSRNQLAVIGTAGAIIQVTKISRDKH